MCALGGDGDGGGDGNNEGDGDVNGNGDSGCEGEGGFTNKIVQSSCVFYCCPNSFLNIDLYISYCFWILLRQVKNYMNII